MYRRFNEDMMAMSGGILPGYSDGGQHLELMSLSCGHTSQVLRAFLDPEFVDENGSGHLIKSDNEKLSEAARL